ncbi:glycosyltransferase, partial [Butyricicoccus sp. 1XD8-22]
MMFTAIITPVIAYADTFTNVYAQYLVIIDWLAVGVISAAGIAWMFGHRSKGIELLISAGIGYIIA